MQELMVYVYKFADYMPEVIIGINIIFAVGVVGYMGYEMYDWRKTVKEYRKWKRWKKCFDVRQLMLPEKPIITSAVDKLIKYVESFGFQVKFTHLMPTSYLHAEQAIILNPDTARREGIFEEHSVLWSIAHEFGHGLSMTKSFSYRGPRHLAKRTVILDEQLAWHLADKCLKKLFPSDKDLFKSFQGIYPHCINSYIKHYAELEND